MELRTITFKAPSGFTYSIREQNGEDEDILSNPREMRTLTHLARFIAAITVDTDFTSSHKLTLNDALALPLLDRACILLQSRIFSIGETLEFSYTWELPDGSTKHCEYEEDLTKYLFDDYSVVPSEEEMEAKPDAVPFYPDPAIIEGKEFTLASGKKVWWQAATNKSEQILFNMPEDKRTRNAELIARNLMLEVNGQLERVTNFSMFSVRDMAEIHKLVKTYDPYFMGLTEVENPITKEKIQYPVISAPGFFFLNEA